MDLGSGSLAGLARLRDYRSRRLSSWDRTGGNFDCVPIQPGETLVLGEIGGAGCVRHIWMTMISMPEETYELRQTVLRMFWDGTAHPGVEVPLGDFFGIGFGLRRNFVSLPLQMSPEDGKGFNCWFPMCFAEGARFEVENQGTSLRMLFFYIFERQVNDWYGEGDDMIFVDEEPWPPRLHGTGTEDYFGTAFCPKQEYCAPYHGLTVYSGNDAWPWGGKNSMYRFHIEDPIRFERSIRVTIETGHNNALANDYSSTAYWYQVGRTEPLPKLPPVEARTPRPDPPELRR